MSIRPLLIASAALVFLGSPSREAFALDPGDILVADFYRGLIRVGAGSEQTLFSVGQGLSGVVTDESGNIFAVATGAVVRIDPNSGTQSVVSQGGDLVFPRAIAFAPDHSLLVLDASARVLIRIDPMTGAQTPVIRDRPVTWLTVGSNGLTHVTMTDGSGFDHLHRVDLATGAMTLVPSPAFYAVQGLVTEASGRVLVSEGFDDDVLAVDPVSGATAILTSRDLSGGELMNPGAMAIEGAGTIVLADKQNVVACSGPHGSTCRGAIYRITPSSGGFLWPISGNGFFADITGVAVYRGTAGTPTRMTSWGSVKLIYR